VGQAGCVGWGNWSILKPSLAVEAVTVVETFHPLYRLIIFFGKAQSAFITPFGPLVAVRHLKNRLTSIPLPVIDWRTFVYCFASTWVFKRMRVMVGIITRAKESIGAPDVK
jgi:hypothetical protein